MISRRSLVLAAAVTAPAVSALTQAKEEDRMTATIRAPSKTGHLDVNGVSYYYEIRGTGDPLLLLHGGLGTIEMFHPVLPILNEGRQTIAIDLQGHGRSTLGGRPIRLTDMGDDMAAIVTALGYDKIDVFGYSMGGGVALRLAVQHPNLVRRLALLSTPFSQAGFYPEMLPQQAAVGSALMPMMKDTPMYKSYVAVAPHPENFPKLLDAMGEQMSRPYDWAEDVKTLKMPVILVYGDSDMITLEHVVRFYHLLGGAQRDAGWQREHIARNRLAILPDLTHYEIGFSPRMANTVMPFLNGESDAQGWAEFVH